MRRTAAGLAASTAAFAWVLAWAPTPGLAASFDCRGRGLSLTEHAICRDPQLSRTEEQTVRRLDGFARRLNFGQYVGLRLWHSGRLRERDRCGSDVACLAGSYRTQMRFLDRLQQCLDVSAQRRACLRNMLSTERDVREDDAGARVSRGVR